MPITPLKGLISDEVLSLPAEDVQRSCGLALDIGSTVGKIVYRSNKEYSDGKPISPQDGDSQGKVHCAMFPRADVTGMINYVKDNCDLTADDSVVKSSGVGGAAFRTQIEPALNCKMKLLPEFDCFCKAFVALEKTTPAEELFTPLSHESQAVIDAEMEKYEALMKAFRESMKDQYKMKFGSDAAGPSEVKEEDNNRPRLLMMAGSATMVMQLNSDGTYSLLDGVFTGGRFMYGLASILTGENDYDKLVEMVESSDGRTVDTWTSDLKGDESTAGPKDNVYEISSREDDRLAYPFGKGVTTPVDSMKKGDLAYSMFNAAAEMHAHLIGMSVKLSKAKAVYVCGNVFNTDIMKLLLCKSNARRLSILPPDLQYEIKFLNNGGMYGALGAFLITE